MLFFLETAGTFDTAELQVWGIYLVGPLGPTVLDLWTSEK